MTARQAPSGMDVLPPGYTFEADLGRRAGVRVVRARRGARAGTSVLLRMEPGAGAEGLAELAVLAAVNHPGIARLVDHGPLPGGGRYLARLWIEGEDLRLWSSSPAASPPGSGTPAERRSRLIGTAIAQLCPALDHLHRQGFVHADLKPENVIITGEADGHRPVLCDFGLTRRAGERSSSGATGSLFALSPEELLGLELTPKADLFALGAMLHRLLVERRPTAREFYARFPASSFLDAAGTDPEELPNWARDLIVNLTARDPARRPSSALVVGRQIAERLGIELELASTAEELRWPVGLGREAWLANWLSESPSSEADEDRLPWLRVPEGEMPRGIWEHLRLYASLRGRACRGIDLDAELRELDDTVALDRWVTETCASSSDWLVVLAESGGAWPQRALAALERELDRRAPRLFVISAADPPDERWALHEVPPVSEPALRRFVARKFAAESEERRSQLVDALLETAQGSATRLEQALGRAVQNGIVLGSDDAYRLRPGRLPSLALPYEAGTTRRAALGTELLDLQTALDVCAGSSTPEEIGDLLRLDPIATGAILLEARSDGWVLLRRERDHTEIRVRQPWPALPSGAAFARDLHARRAKRFEKQDDRGAALVHGFCASASRDDGRELAEHLAELRELGRAEHALELGDRLKSAALGLELDLCESAPEALIELARAWIAIGQPGPASELVARLDASETQLFARLELLRASDAALRHDTDQAFEHFNAAAEHDPALRGEATVGLLQLLHSAGRDRELMEAVQAFDPGAREAAGELSARQRRFVQSLEAMSALRLGEAERARGVIAGLLGEVADDSKSGASDIALEAALRINLGIIERLAGSFERARSELELAIERYDAAGLIAGLAHARATLGGLLREMGALEEAEAPLLSAVEIRQRLGDAEGAATARGMLGLLYFERGHALQAIETLESTIEAMSGAQLRRHAPLLRAKAAEMSLRAGREVSWQVDEEAAEADPRVLVAGVRIAWLRGDRVAAQELVGRAIGFAESLGLARLADEARDLAQRVAHDKASDEGGSEGDRDTGADSDECASLLELDRRLFAALEPEAYDAARLQRLAERLEKSGRDDRAARTWFAVAARSAGSDIAPAAFERGEAAFERCSEGASRNEAEALRRHLLGEPDPWPSDLLPPASTTEDLEMEIISLLEINHRLIQQRDLESLLGVIVEHALSVTGAERGFLVLEEHGELRFDTALDSCRGDIDQPEFEISQSIVREALQRMEPMRLSNAVDDPLLGHQTSVVSLELRSILCVPILISDSLRGAIYLDHRLRKGAFDDRAQRLCSLLADQAALAIQQVKRLEEIRHLNRELERRVVERESDLMRARRALREAGVETKRVELLGGSRAMRDVRELLAKSAPSQLSVLIVGESGTGKELAARALHELSHRRAGPFVSESCAALPASLIESELFGYRRGAFTGADRDRAGLVEQADGGTLFLDEVGELPLDLQAKLLRVLETSEVRRLGDEDPVQVDFRLVVATNRDLEDEIRHERFRRDLFYRMNGLQVRMPSLSERPEDIEPLARRFLAEQCADGPERRLARSVIAALARRSWPGNVRELKNEISRLCVLSDGDLSDPSLVSVPATLGAAPTPSTVVPLAELERTAILHALEQTGGDKRKAAELLGISRAKIYQRLKDWNAKETG